MDHCLKSIETQATIHHAEVLVVVTPDTSYDTRLVDDYPWIRLVTAEERTVPALRGRGVDEATGDVVAVIEEHCSARAD